MKTLKTKIILFLVAISISFTACMEEESSNFSSKKFLKHYKNSDHVIGFSLPPGLLRIFVDRDEKDLRELLKQIDNVSFLIFSDDYFTKISTMELFKEMDKELTANNFQDLLIVKEKGEQVKFKIQEKNNKVKEIIMLVAGLDEVVVMNISGNIDLADIDLITESIDVKKIKNYK